MKTTHTPGPYWIDADGFIAADNGGNEVTFADVYCRPSTECTDKMSANAAFIVRACNAHDGLVSALEGALAYLGDDSRSERRRAANMAFIEVALAKAKGE